MNSKGTENRYSKDGGGNHIESLRNKGVQCGVFLAFQKRFCETCQQSKPKDSLTAKKGWKCKECRSK